VVESDSTATKRGLSEIRVSVKVIS